MSSSSVRRLGVALLGAGNVGRTLIDQILSSRTYHLERYNVVLDVRSIADGSGTVLLPHHTSDDEIRSLLQFKKQGHALNTHAWATKLPTEQLISSLSSSSVVVDCSASSSTIPFLVSSVEKGGGVALANKKPLSASQAVWDQLFAPAHRKRVRAESTVGAGTPFVTVVERVMAAADSITKIQGTFSGTLGYVVSGLEAGRKYSDVVLEAKQLGYTEPDPRDDLGGVDVARKALILARSIGWRLELSDVSIEPLFPASMSTLSIPDFLSALPSLDIEFSKRVAEAEKQGHVLRYVATIHNNQLKVGLQALSKSSPLGQLTGSENMLEVYSTTYPEKPLVVRGSGAGADITARGLLADLIELAALLAV